MGEYTKDEYSSTLFSTTENNEHPSTLVSTTENKETRDGKTSTTFNPRKHTDKFTSGYSDTTIDYIYTTLSEDNDQYLEYRKKKFFWFLLLLPSSCLILILIPIIGWRCGKFIKNRRCSAENQVSNSYTEDIETTNTFNENFQETSFGGRR